MIQLMFPFMQAVVQQQHIASFLLANTPCMLDKLSVYLLVIHLDSKAC